jgi:hypothetical protein
METEVFETGRILAARAADKKQQPRCPMKN